MKNIFTKEVSEEIIARIEKLRPESKPLWGKMNVAQMLAHCNVTYDLVYDPKYKKATGFKRFMLKLFVKGIVVSEKPYSRNSRTAPEFLITNVRDFIKERTHLVENVRKTAKLGEKHFDGKESHSFGVLNKTEWNNMFYKHLDHHLTQFGV